MDDTSYMFSSVNKKSFGYASFSLHDFLGFSGCMIVAANVGELDKESNSYNIFLSVAIRFLLRSTWGTSCMIPSNTPFLKMNIGYLPTPPAYEIWICNLIRMIWSNYLLASRFARTTYIENGINDSLLDLMMCNYKEKRRKHLREWTRGGAIQKW